MEDQMFIEFANSNFIFFAGQNIVGKFILRVKYEKKINEIGIKIVGKGNVLWSEEKRDGDEVVTHTYQANEKYSDFYLPLLNAGHGRDIVLPAGDHFYPFQILLPPNIPSTFRGNSGKIIYHIEATVKTPFTSLDIKTLIPINIVGMLDPNLQVGMNTPFENHQSKSVCCFCCRSGPITLTIKMTKTGFVPGESVNFFAEVNNNSSRKIKEISASFIQHNMYIADKNSKKEEIKLCQITGPLVSPGESEGWQGNFTMPTVPPTNLGYNSKIINISYFLQIRANVEKSFSLYTNIPIIIGTIPQGSGQNYENSTSIQNMSQTQSSQIPMQNLPPSGPASGAVNYGFINPTNESIVNQQEN